VSVCSLNFRRTDPLSAAREAVEAADVVFEVVAIPEQTPLVQLAERLGKNVIRRTEVIALQAAEQFFLYTGIRPTNDQIARASTYSRSD
jgi:shikimate dehydrogenase